MTAIKHYERTKARKVTMSKIKSFKDTIVVDIRYGSQRKFWDLTGHLLKVITCVEQCGLTALRRLLLCYRIVIVEETRLEQIIVTRPHG